jgi:hypothetical protein
MTLHWFHECDAQPEVLGTWICVQLSVTPNLRCLVPGYVCSWCDMDVLAGLSASPGCVFARGVVLCCHV